MTDSVARLYNAVIAARGSDPAKSRPARLLRPGRAKMAKKLAEEAVEVVIDAMHGQPEAVVRESADLLYNLVVLWVHSGVHPDDVWAEMSRREQIHRRDHRELPPPLARHSGKVFRPPLARVGPLGPTAEPGDRKSTRLNSSHLG